MRSERVFKIFYVRTKQLKLNTQNYLFNIRSIYDLIIIDIVRKIVWWDSGEKGHVDHE